MSQSIGQPLSRADGREKVTGGARYTADVPIEEVTHGFMVTGTIPHGRVTKIDTGAAEAAMGVLKVLTYRNTPRLQKIAHPPAGQSYLPLQDEQILYEGQPVALVVAKTLEQAQHAASLVKVEYERQPALVNFRRARSQAIDVKNFAESDTKTGDAAVAIADSAVRIKQTYTTADRHHNAMELSGTIAEWRDGKLYVYDATQYVWGVRLVVSQALGIKPEDIRVRSSFLGGGFGCKGYVWPHQILAAVAAREVGRPVKLVLSRAHAYTSHGYQTASEQTLELAASKDGKLAALRHKSITPTSPFDDYVEYGAIGTRSMYACPAIETQNRVVRVNRNTPTPMRAPHEGLSMFGLECAMDELASELGIDPVELRLRNYAEKDPTTGKPFSAKSLRECYRQGMERFNWARRKPKPGSMRDGNNLIGLGMASAIMTTFRFPAKARATLESSGNVTIEAGTQEIGTGVYTVMPQIAAEVLGIPVERVRLVLGDTTLPETGGTFGSSTTLSVGSAVHDAATKLRQKIAMLAGEQIQPQKYADVLERKGLERLSAEGEWSPGANASPLGEVPDWSMHTFGAVFAEVRVDKDLLTPRLTRCVGVYSAGRIINPKTASSQITGGMIWGIGQALLEQSEIDERFGKYISKNLGEYHVPVNADVPLLEVFFVDEEDRQASTVGAKGIGELGAVGVGPAIANAIYHATGKRIRDLPITLDKLL